MPARRRALVTDATVQELHQGAIRSLLSSAEGGVIAAIGPGERHKTREVKQQVEDLLIGAGLGRDSAILALGGGVVTDLAGFVAATYMRGVPWVAIPTTLLAMVDASIGGKTAVDHPLGKNLIGAFHQPAMVFVDVDFLGTLPAEEMRQGLAEIAKAAAIGDADLFAMLSANRDAVLAGDPGVMIDIIARSCAVKAAVVAADEAESDLRLTLNFGHTIGHALEQVTGWTIPHGDAVAIGMVAESLIAAGEGLLPGEASRSIERTLSDLALPVAWPPGVAIGDVLDAAKRDKKTRAGGLVFALPAGIGRMARGEHGYGIPIETHRVSRVLETMRTRAGAP
jgi:3-dehydroquinate synthase